MTQSQMLITAVVALGTVIIALAGVISYLGRDSLKRAKDESKRACEVEDRAHEIQKEAFRRWEEQTAALYKVVNALEINNQSLTQHDQLNGVAHREASERLADVARVQSATLRQLEIMNGGTKNGTRKSRK